MNKTEPHRSDAASIIGIIVFLGTWLVLMVYAEMSVWAKVLLTLIMIPFFLVFFIGIKGRVKVKVKN